MSYYYNAAGQRFDLPERPLEPLDCRPWASKSHALVKKTAPSAANTESGNETPQGD